MDIRKIIGLIWLILPWLFLIILTLVLFQFIIVTGSFPDTFNTEYDASYTQKIVLVSLYVSVLSLFIKLAIELYLIIIKKKEIKHFLYLLLLFVLMYLITVRNVFKLFTWLMG